MPLPRRRAAAVAATGLLLLGVAGCADGDGGAEDGGSGGSGGGDAQAVNPYAGHPGYADPDSRTAQAAADARGGGNDDQAEVFDRLARVPQGIWLTPEQYPAGEVGPFVAGIVADADAAGQVPTFVVYGIPDRDCSGGFSGGGLSADRYGPWVQEIADAARDGEDVAVVVEPDALASAVQCDRRDERVALISDAVDRLTGAGLTTYLDGGHSHWIGPAELAPLLEEAGIDEVRGFATDVSNFQSDEDERAYAERLSQLVGGAHYVIDSGRNGFGSTQEWCNPSGRAFGTAPTGVTDAGNLDAYLWIKPPGESDGECNGGPPAGRFWPDRVMELASASGW